VSGAFPGQGDALEQLSLMAFVAAQALDGRTGERRPFSGSTEEIESDIAAFAKLGVSEIVFDFRSERLEESLERIERFAPMLRLTARV
jgi:hypothetical protein